MYEDFKIDKIIEPALRWYAGNKRDLPWRQEKNAYYTWVSEIMLQQTRVEAVKPYYSRFLTALPTIRDLADCPEDELMKLWEGLGYYSRVRNLQKAARVICETYEGSMPQTFDEIIKLPGIGAYTAGAVSSIAFGEAQPAVDGNVLRILARLSEDDIDIKSELAKKRAYALLKPVMPAGEDAGNFNQALMDIGASICVPNGKPLCEQCPWGNLCMCKKHGSFEQYPVRSKGKPRRIEEKTVILLRVNGKVMIAKRPDKGLLAGLYEFPNLSGYLGEQEISQWVKGLGLTPKNIARTADAKHIFSHVEWRMHGFEVEALAADDINLRENAQYGSEKSRRKTASKREILFVSPKEIADEYAIPSAFSAYTNTLTLS